MIRVQLLRSEMVAVLLPQRMVLDWNPLTDCWPLGQFGVTDFVVTDSDTRTGGASVQCFRPGQFRATDSDSEEVRGKARVRCAGKTSFQCCAKL